MIKQKFINIAIAFTSVLTVSVPFVFLGFNLPDPKILTFSLLTITANLIYFTLISIFIQRTFGFTIVPRFENFLTLIFLLKVLTDLWIINRTRNGLGDIESDLGLYFTIFSQLSEEKVTDLGIYPKGYFALVLGLHNTLSINLNTIVKFYDFVFLTITPLLSSIIVSKFANKRIAYIFFVLLLIMYPNNSPWKYFIEVIFITTLFLVSLHLSQIEVKDFKPLKKKQLVLWIITCFSLTIFMYPLPIYLTLLIIFFLFAKWISTYNVNILSITIALVLSLIPIMFNAPYVNNLKKYGDLFVSQNLSSLLFILTFIVLLSTLVYKYKARSSVTLLFFLTLATGLLLIIKIGDTNDNYLNKFFTFDDIFPYFPLLILFLLIELFLLNTSIESTLVITRLSNTLTIYLLLVLTKSILLLKFVVTSDMSLALRLDSLFKYLLLISLSLSLSVLNFRKILGFNKILLYSAAIFLIVLFSIYRSLGLDFLSNLSSIYIWSLRDAISQ